MYITQEQLNRRLIGFESLVEKEKKKVVKLNVEEKALIGSLALQSSVKEVKEAFGISSSVVSLAAKGIDTIKEGINPELKQKVSENTNAGNTKKETAREAALDNLVGALGIVKLTAPNIKKATDAANVAKSMAEIVDKLDGGNRESGSRVNILIHAPGRREENQYEVIEVG